MERFPPGDDPADLNGHGHDEEEWAEALTRSVAHLAAQLTVNQIRLRALATELGERGLVDPVAIAARVRSDCKNGNRRLPAREPRRKPGRRH